MTDIPQTDTTQVLFGEIPTELWAVEITYLPEIPNELAVAQWFEERAERGEDVEALEFFWPTLARVYRSRSGARSRLALFESYGARGHLVRANPSWEPVETKDAKIARLEARIAELEYPSFDSEVNDIRARVAAGMIPTGAVAAAIKRLREIEDDR